MRLEILRLRQGKFHYQAEIGLSEDSPNWQTLPINGGFLVRVPVGDSQEFTNKVRRMASINQVTIDENGGILQCLYTGTMLYPIEGERKLGEIHQQAILQLLVISKYAIPVL